MVTLGNNKNFSAFCNTCRVELERYVEVTPVLNEDVMGAIMPTSEDVIIFFNRTDQAYAEYFISFIQYMLQVGCSIFPVAMTEAHRQPPSIISTYQSYDVVEQLQQRKLTDSQVETVAIAEKRYLGHFTTSCK